MKAKDIVNYAVKSLKHSKLRTWLTIIGIVIGISSVIVLVSIGQGLDKSISDQLSQFGSSTIIIIPVNLEASGGPSFSGNAMRSTTGKLFLKDYEEIRKLGSIDTITPVISQRASVEYKGKEITSSVGGIFPETYQSVFKSVEIGEGRMMSDYEKGSVIVGSSMAENSAWKEDIQVNSYLNINGKNFRVVGILNKTGNSFANIDDMIYINYYDAQDLFENQLEDKEINAITLEVKEDFDPEEVAEEIREKLRNLHKVREGEEDFGLITSKFINDTIGSIGSILSVFLGAIAAISLLVGGVGIMNTMFMSVVERTAEIGTLKAIGASEKEILAIFLVESGVIGLVGGLIGVVLAILILFVLEGFAVPVVIKDYVVIGAFLFSFIVGIISGAIPSKRAAEISPLEALRYE
ncbi:ABC transporter permease [Candidatus Micrarchaeota archaeon]|nr:ABC transporter permease [Candidatus Micrarchaeota archaeon]